MKKIYQFDQDEIDAIVQSIEDAKKIWTGDLNRNYPEMSMDLYATICCLDMAIHLLTTDNADKPAQYDE